MSLPWMSFWVAEYVADTMHLSQAHHGAYILLICHYWQRGPIESKHCYSIARAIDEQSRSIVDDVLEQFFIKDGDLYRHERVEKELQEAKTKHEKRAKAGRKGGLAKKRNKEQAMPEQSSSNASELLNQSQQQLHDPNGSVKDLGEPAEKAVEPVKKPPAKSKIDLPDWLPMDEWMDFIEMRKRIRAPATDQAVKLLIGNLEKLRAQGHDPADCLNQSTANGYRGVFAPKAASRVTVSQIQGEQKDWDEGAASWRKP